MAKKSLAVAALKAESVQQFIGAKLVEAGEALGTYTVSSEIDKVATVKLVDESLRAAMKAGLQRDMLKAGSQCYLSFTGAISAVREANELEPISNGTRDNYMSRIRDFISARGAEPLDLYGNIAEAKRKAAKAVALKEAEKTIATMKGENDDVEDEDVPKAVTITQPKQVDVIGAPALAMFLTAWIAANGKTGALEKIGNMAVDLLNVCKAQGVKVEA